MPSGVTFVPSPDWRAVLARQTLPGARLIALRVMALAIEICPRAPAASRTGGGDALYQTHFFTENVDPILGWVLRVGANKPYAYFVHQGTTPHLIPGKPTLHFYWPGAPMGAGFYFFAHVSHPGTKPQPWLWKSAGIIIRSHL